MQLPVRLIELWLTLCHDALCRVTANGLLAQLPASPPVLVSDGLSHSRLAVRLAAGDPAELQGQAIALFGDTYQLCTVIEDIDGSAPPSAEPYLSLRRVFSELQTHLLESGDPVPADAELLTFFLKHGEYRSQHVSLHRMTYHVVPHQGGWRLKRQGQQDGESFTVKDDAVRAGAKRARSHSAGQLIIHAADGTFQEERTYGRDPGGSPG